MQVLDAGLHIFCEKPLATSHADAATMTARAQETGVINGVNLTYRNVSALQKARDIAGKITAALGGRGIFGVELFIRDDDVIFSEVSPRPHDTGMVTMISQDLSQFALHARAILGLPVPNIHFHGPSASSVILVQGDSDQPSFENLDSALQQEDTQLRLFGKPEVSGQRRMGVVLARGDNVEEARNRAITASGSVQVKL